MAPLLAARGVSRTFTSGNSRFTLVIEDLALSAGDCVAVVGPSGCGKSTMLGLLALALRPDTATELSVAGNDAKGLWQERREDSLAAVRARSIGFVPQTAALLPFLSVRGNIGLPQAILGLSDPAFIDGLAAWLGIAEVMARRPNQVSVGQRQRAAVARALAHRPPIVLADEPTASVHPTQADEILRRLIVFAREQGTGIVITTHDLARAEAAGFRIAPCRTETETNTTLIAWAA
jgi:putative ABC transport system ATP-binding protein